MPPAPNSLPRSIPDLWAAVAEQLTSYSHWATGGTAQRRWTTEQPWSRGHSPAPMDHGAAVVPISRISDKLGQNSTHRAWSLIRDWSASEQGYSFIRCGVTNVYLSLFCLSNTKACVHVMSWDIRRDMVVAICCSYWFRSRVNSFLWRFHHTLVIPSSDVVQSRVTRKLCRCVNPQRQFLSKSRSLQIIVCKSTQLYVIICKERDLEERDIELEDFRDRVPSNNRNVWFTMQ